MLENKNARLVIVKNPFQPWNGRIIKEIAPHTKLRDELIGNANIGCDIYTSVDGKTVLIDDYEVLGGELITVSPVVGKSGGKILGLVAMVALAVVSMGVGSAVAGGAMFGHGAIAMSAWGFSAYAAAAAVMFIGGQLISKAFYSAPKTPSLTNMENEATYGWNGVQTLEGQNNAIAMTYGKVQSGGQTIGKFVEVRNNKEYLNWLIACGEGELEFSNILINDNPVEYYDGMELETRTGTNNQEVIPYFNDTYFTKSLGYQLLDDWRTDTAQGNATQGLIVKIEFSNGLYYANDQGGLDIAWVDLAIEYRPKNGQWEKLANAGVSGNQSSAIRKEYRVDNLPAGEYDVRVRVTGRSHSVTNSRASVRCYWSSLTSVVYDDFAYPNIALIGVRALATDQISGSPTIKFIKERKNVWVYNPYTQQYEQRPANNPAWASYDMLHLASRLYNVNTDEYEFDVRGVPAHSMLYDHFSEWARFCEAKKYYVNIEIGATEEMLNCINDNIACIGHGMVVRFGTKYGAVWYCKKQPVQMFGMGNIISGTFKEDFLETNDRANGVEITYTDAEHDYNRETITIFSDTYDTSATENLTQVTFNGITSYEQAYREGKYQLYANKYQLRTVSFETNVDAIACTIGDVVLVSHDVPQWSHSGRIYEVDVKNGIFTLPVELQKTDGNIRLMYRTVNDNLYTVGVTVLENNNGWCKVQGNISNTEDLPQKNDIFDIGLTSIGNKPFIVTNISRAQDFTRNISGIEYIEALYDEDYDVPPIQYSESLSDKAENVYSLVARCYRYSDGDGVYRYNLSASWECNKNSTYNIYVSYDDYNWILIASDIKTTEFETVSDGAFKYIKVISKYKLNISSGVSSEIESLNYAVVPSVRNLTAYSKYREGVDDITRYDIQVEWQIPLNYPAYFQSQIWYKTNNVQTKDVVVVDDMPTSQLGFNNDWIFGGQGYNSAIIPQAVIGDTYKIAVCVQDNNGKYQPPNEATQIEIVVAMKTETPNTPANLKVSLSDVVKISWDEVRNADIKYYEVRTDRNIGVTSPALLGRVTEAGISTNAITERQGTIYVFSVSAYNKFSAPAIIDYNFPISQEPIINAVAKIQGIECEVENIPQNTLGVRWFFNGLGDVVEFSTNSLTHFQSTNAGIYEVTACYYDYFGNGATSIPKTVTVKTTIPSEMIENNSITMEKLTQEVSNAIEEGGIETVNIAVKGILGRGAGLTLQDDGTLALATSDGKVLTGLFIDSDGMLVLDGRYIHITGDTIFDKGVIVKNIEANSITADKMNVSSLSAISVDVGTFMTQDLLSACSIAGGVIRVYGRESVDDPWVYRVGLGLLEQ